MPFYIYPKRRLSLKKIFCLLLIVMCLVFSGCSDKPYAIAKEYISLMWDVDYRDFSPEETTAFAKAHYTEAFLADYLYDVEYASGELENKSTKLISHIGDFKDLGCETELLDDLEYTVQKLSAVLYIESYKPEDPEMSFFEEGKRFDLLFSVYFLREDGKLKIESYGFEPIGEEFLPAGEKERLTADEQAELFAAAKNYLFTRNDIKEFDADEQWKYYSENCTEEFLTRDEISPEYLLSFGEEIGEYDVSVEVLSYNIIVGEQKQSHFDGETAGFYYWAELDYTIGISAEDAYFLEKNMQPEQEIKEKLYFIKENGHFYVRAAEYL